MAHKMIRATGETITYQEASDILEQRYSYTMSEIISLVEEATDDEEERANAKVNLATSLGYLMNAAEMKGVLRDEDDYIDELFSAVAKDYPDARKNLCIEDIPES